MGCRSGCILWLAAAALAVLTLQLHSAAAAPMDLSNPVEHNHFLLLAPYGDSHRSGATADRGNTARYVQLSNGSRFVCDTTSIKRRDPLDAKRYSLRHQMESLMTVMRSSDHPCVHYAEENYVTVYCWDKEVREDALTENKGRSLGRRRTDGPQMYWASNDAFGRYAATVYGDGDECQYDMGRRIETEVHFYCRYSEFENPIPYMSIHESSQCRYMLRLLSSKFCSVSQLDHPSEEETVRCQMLAD
ncbi:conserved hypothetical protein [Leishmania mexicana MHOM/GT/2001/U1103]|uniref:MRH domain-containing protein n=1 Tax=Leishmania mexicana (strain MHOM/GT/2001/U1103) TaxID=929439 RepID=E9ATV6_LEIMU|nr:conserved hypothetical protein [Leishmania mexicana MHOM/GT/2001/U1103]CBZ26381.1 conserved hypothetical protein [Leishmania mexicana MHOM/GT/2001/U1103]